MVACPSQVTGFGYEHDEAWAANMELFRHFTGETTGVRRLGAAAVDLCHVALGAKTLRSILHERTKELPDSLRSRDASCKL